MTEAGPPDHVLNKITSGMQDTNAGNHCHT